MDKKFVNSVKCPICGSPIDRNNGQVGFHCATNKDHYRVYIRDNFIINETVSLYDFKKLHKYVVIKDSSNSIKFTIFIQDIDAEGRVIFDFTENHFETNVNIFDFKNFNKDKAIEKIKTVMLFE